MSAFAPSSKPRLALLGLSLCLAGVAGAQAPAELPEGRFPPVLVQAAKDGVVVRAEPGYLYAELRTLRRGERVTATQRQGRWLGLRPEGWVAADEVADATRSLPTEGPLLVRVQASAARVRSGPGTENAVVGGRQAGDLVEVVKQVGDWWQLAEGGWLHASLVSVPRSAGAAPPPPRPRAPDAPARPLPTGEQVRRWSFMDLNGTLFEIFELDPRTPFLAGLRRAIRETGVLEDDWTFLRLVVSVPEGRLSFRYSPASDGNPVSVVDAKGERYGSVFAQGPVERIPAHLRGFFQDQVVPPGQRFEGLLMFRPTLDARTIRTVQMRISGRVRTFFETP